VTPINISLVNFSTLYDDSKLPILANALQLQMSKDIGPIWGVNVKIWYTPSGGHPTADHWILGLFDDSDVAQALGYHDLGPSLQPLGKVFVRTTLNDGQKVEVTASHEAAEMVADPFVNASIEVDDPVLGVREYALENADAVENIEYMIDIPAGWTGAGTQVPVSDIVTKNWFQPSAPGPYDLLGKVTKPLQLTPGGYISFRDLNNLSAGWQQISAMTDPRARMQARPRIGSRRALRMIPGRERIRSTYDPGVSAIPAQSNVSKDS
jgi:hypothetical protein